MLLPFGGFEKLLSSYSYFFLSFFGVGLWLGFSFSRGRTSKKKRNGWDRDSYSGNDSSKLLTSAHTHTPSPRGKARSRSNSRPSDQRKKIGARSSEQISPILPDTPLKVVFETTEDENCASPFSKYSVLRSLGSLFESRAECAISQVPLPKFKEIRAPLFSQNARRDNDVSGTKRQCSRRSERISERGSLSFVRKSPTSLGLGRMRDFVS